MNNILLDRLRKLQKVRGDITAFSNHDEFLLWSDSISPLLEFDEVLCKKFTFWSDQVKSANRRGREHHDALGECIGVVNQSITKLELQPSPTKKAQSAYKNVEYPNKITLNWLYKHVPWSFWVWFIGLLISAFSLGLIVSETPLYKVIKSNISSTNTLSKKP
ncbi:hypothetical protein [Desulfoluna butyratoxydans]|uniref:hypothetical protein n=1 Tax=Desulfoluna butyratoxydans TaxID=231438 RepID=UPI0015D317A6|nr:hypothetical protein [Desulfoluna butyratoxydans]